MMKDCRILQTERKISVIIPVYNAEKYMSRCLDSILGNTYKNLEVICVDDGSTDLSANICNEYASRDCRIKVIQKSNGGAASARNIGLEMASGDFIAFIDSDDYVHSEYFSIMMEALENNSADIVLCDYICINDSSDFSKKKIPYQSSVISREDLMSKHGMKSFVWGRIYTKNIIGRVRFDANIKVEDAVFNALLMQMNADVRIVHIDLQLYAYYQREDSLMSGFGTDVYSELSLFYFECAILESNLVMKNIFATESVKRGLSAMLNYWMDRDALSVRKCQRMMWKSVKFVDKYKLLYLFFISFPRVYKWFRFMKDPSLRGWKRKNKEPVLPEE